MARIAGINLPSEKKVEIGLTYIYGIGRTFSNQILQQTGINKDKRVKDLNSKEIEKIQSFIKKSYQVEGALKRRVIDNIKRLQHINCYRGIRHSKNLPARGQRTRTNSRTVRGNVRRTIGGMKAPPTKKG